MVEDYNENYGSGWVSIYRSIQRHWIFENDKYFKWWVIILFEVNHSNSKITRNYEIHDILKGQSCNSLRTWGILFKTTPKTVSRFFDLLEKDKMITRSNIGKGKQALTLINVINYVDYQKVSKQVIPQEVNKEETNSKQTLPTNNNDNNYNNIYSDVEFLKDWNEARIKIGRVKHSNFNKLHFSDRNNFKELIKTNKREDFKNGMRGLFMQNTSINSIKSSPSHFLDKDNMQKYIDAHLNKKQLYSDNKKIDRL